MVNGSTSRPRSFLVEIHNTLEEEDYIKVLLHELWHVYQYIKGRESESEALRWEEILYDEYVTNN